MIETLQTSIKAVSDYGGRPGSNDPTGLIDSGASACMRAKIDGDVVVGVRVVSLAQGEAEVEVNQAGTLLTSQQIEPIVSARHLIKCGFKITWSRRAFLLLDPQGVAVPAVIQAGCPRVTRSVALSLIDLIEKTSLEEEAAVEESVRVARASCADDTAPWTVGMEKLRDGCQDRDLVKAQAWHRITLQSLFPEVPHELVDSTSWLVSPEGVKGVLNRRQRRSIEQSQGVILHLFCGRARRAFDSVASRFGLSVLPIDVEEDLLNPAVYSYILSLALTGRLVAVLSGLPCRTRSVMRGQGSGPPVVRSRDGEGRWGLPELPQVELGKVQADDELWIKQLFVSIAAQWGLHQTSEGLRLGYVLENPRDPYELFGKAFSTAPSLWVTPEYLKLQEALNLSQFHVDQGALGHERRKPTTIATTAEDWPEWCRMVTGGGFGSGGEQVGDSALWAKWAPGLIEAVEQYLASIATRFRQQATKETVKAARARLSRQTVTQTLQDHVAAGHIPYNKACWSCLMGRLKQPPHFRQPITDSYVLSVDLSGPFAEGVHEGVKARYFLAANLSVPFDVHVAESGRPVADKPDEPAPSASEEPAEWEQAGDYEEPDADHKQVGELLPEEGVDEDNYLSKVQMVNIPFGILLKNKGAQEVLRALKLIDARASCLGIKIARLHSDKGAEFDNRFVRDWAASRGIWKSSTGGDNWRSNGAAEALVGILKDSVRVLLRDAGLGPRDWPYALRHAAGRLFQSRVKALGWDLPPLVPFGAKVFVHRLAFEEGC